MSVPHGPKSSNHSANSIVHPEIGITDAAKCLTLGTSLFISEFTLPIKKSLNSFILSCLTVKPAAISWPPPEWIIFNLEASKIISPKGIPLIDLPEPLHIPSWFIEITHTGRLYNSFILPATIPIIPSWKSLPLTTIAFGLILLLIFIIFSICPMTDFSNSAVNNLLFLFKSSNLQAISSDLISSVSFKR